MPANVSVNLARLSACTARFGLIGLLVFATSACTFVSTGARSAVVILVRHEVTTAGSGSLPMPPRDEIRSALSPHFLWLADDTRAAQWIAYLDVRTPPTPLQPFGLTVIEVKKNPDWRPWEVSPPLPTRNDGTPPSFKLQEAFEQSERSKVSR